MKLKLTILLLCLSSLAWADHHGGGHDHQHKAQDKHQQHAQQTLELSPELQQLLGQEMQQIRAGMESLVLAQVSADWGTIASVGKQIKQSYVFKQQLTKKQRHELHQKLPSGFIKLDQKFHQYAGMLAHVAEKKNIELVNFYIYKMNETCANCHASYAKHRFSGFAAESQHSHEITK